MRHLWLGLVFVLSQPLLAFDYFGNSIDYWKPDSPTQMSKPVKPSPPPPKKPFEWDKYMDPAHDEFFKEGDYTPPKPFMELARNPTDENIRNWMAMVEMKNKLMQRMHTQIEDYLKREGAKLKSEEKAELVSQMNDLPKVAQDAARFRFRLYFDSSCPHCERMMTTAKDLQNLGYYIEARQIDREKPTFAIPIASTLASSQEVKAQKITAWPVLFVGDTKKQLVYRIQGFHDTPTILNVLNNK